MIFADWGERPLTFLDFFELKEREDCPPNSLFFMSRVEADSPTRPLTFELLEEAIEKSRNYEMRPFEPVAIHPDDYKRRLEERNKRGVIRDV